MRLTVELINNSLSYLNPLKERELDLRANNFAELADLDVLSKFHRLTHLSLLENPVTRKEHYRYWIIWRCPTVRFLDYRKVKDVERARATELFGTAQEPSALAAKIIGIKSRTFDIPSSSLANGSASAGDKSYRVKLTDKEKKRVEALIRNAKSLQEITRLEKELNEGRIPGGPGGGDEMEE
ncbi:U2 snRNP complex subunit [Lecanora helva]